MKKLYTLMLGTLAGGIMMAQTPFWSNVNYKGAFPVTDNTANTDWTADWTNWDPENQVYPAATATVTGSITSNTTWTTGTVVKLSGIVYVKSNAVLTIQPGVTILGSGDGPGGINDVLVITRGAKIIAQGTPSQPIVFTSANTVADSRASGDWGGLVILGKGKINQGTNGETYIEGFENAATNADLFYGGTDDADSSGVLSYVRIEFAGVALSSTPNSEINGLTFGGVGSKTKVDHIQVSFSGDDSFEWFGGKVDAKYLVAFRGLDDDFDTDFGYSGRVQFGLIIRDKDLSDQAGDSNGFESDNNAAGDAKTPRTSAIFSNVTCVGPKGDGTVSLPGNEKFNNALRLRRNTGINVFNSIFTGWEKGLYIEGAATMDNYHTGAATDSAFVSNNLFTSQPFSIVTNTLVTTAYYNNFFSADGNDSTKTNADVKWVSPFAALNTKADYRLNTGSAAVSPNSLFSHSIFAGQILGVKQNEQNNVSVAVYPNPSTANAQVALNLQNSATASIILYDITGKAVKEICQQELSAGTHYFNVNAQDFASGIYFIKVQANSQAQTLKWMLSHN